MQKWFLAALGAVLFAACAYAQVFDAFPNWTTNTRFGDSPGTVGFNITTNLPEWLDTAATWHSFTPTDNPIVSGTFKQTTAYSAAGTALPACNAGSKGARAWVTDATSPTYLGTYTGGSTTVAPVFCNGTSWLTD